MSPPLRFSPRALLALVGALAALAMLLALGGQSTAAAKPSGVSRQCQHPLVTGQEATKIKNVSPKTACKVVRSLARFMETGKNGSSPLFKCVGGDRNHPGHPVLKIRTFEGWNLKVVHEYGFKMYMGRASFEVSGQDFPLNCS